METIIVNETGGTYFFNYNLGGNCSAGDVVSFRESPSNWIHVYTDIVVQNYEHPFKVVCDGNTGSGTRDGQVIPIINEGLSTEKVCNDKAITFRQTGTTCGCEDITVEVGENNMKVTTTSPTATDDETEIPIIIETDKQNKCEPISGETTYCVKKETVRVLYPSIDENGNESWSPDGIIPASGGTVMVGFDYDWFATQTDCDGKKTDLTGTDSYVDEIEIPACDCNEDDCGDIVIDTEFKKAHEGDCNKFTYTVRQESCLKK